MALNTAIKTDISFKRLAGNKSITNTSFSPADEKIASNIQSSADRLFGEAIPSNPGGTDGLGATALFDTASGGTVQLVEFDLKAIAGSKYNAQSALFLGQSVDESGTIDTATLTTHSFALTFKEDYVTQDGSNDNGASQNPRANTGFFKNNLPLTGSNGQVQIVPELYGVDYRPQIFSQNGTELFIASNFQDFYLDTYAGVLFRQDGDNDPGNVPATLRAYVYIGKMVSESLADTFPTPSLQEVTTVGNTTDTGIIVDSNTGIIVSGSVGNTGIAVTGSAVDFSQASSITASIVSASEINVAATLDVGGATTLNNGVTVVGDADISNNLVVGGNLSVIGTTTTIQTQDLVVEDKFILLASSSAANNTLTTDDGGIIVQRGRNSSGQLVGTALFYDADRLTWAINRASHSIVNDLVSHTSTGDLNAELNIITVDIQGDAPASTGQGEFDRPRPLIGKDDSSFNVGQMFVDTSDATNGGLYIYLPE